MRKKIVSFLNSCSSFSFLIIFFVVGIIIFGHSLFNSFVGDDLGYINHPYIQSFNIIKFFIGSSTDLGGSSFVSGQFYRPLMLLLLSSIYLFFQKNVFFYHFIQLLFFAANGFLLYLLLKKFTSKITAFIGGLIFLVHPINSEAVLYVSNFQDVLFVFFGLLGFFFFSQKKSSQKDIILTCLFLFLSLLAKETGILFIVIYFLYQVLFTKTNKTKWLLIFLSLFVFYFVLRFGVAQLGFSNSIISPISSLSMTDRLKFFPSIFSYYLYTVIFPKNLAIAQTWITSPKIFIDYLITFFFIIIVLIFTVWFYKKRRKYFSEFLFFLLWFLFGLISYIQIIPLEMTVADRWFYFPFIGLIGIIIISIKKIKLNNSFFYVTITFTALIISIFSTRSFLRSLDWENPIILYTHDSKITQSYLLEHSLGYELMQKNKMEEAFKHLKKSVLIFQTPYNTNSLGVYYYKTNDIKNAITWFKKSISLGDYFLSYQNYARILVFQSNSKDTIGFLQKASEKFPHNDVFFFLLAISYYKNNDHDNALIAAQKAYNISPSRQNGYVVYQLLNYEQIQIK